ncbi:hypothetical protein Btru_058138 [Bulinus truncatus]|nr:hypothetical protein Btru_058138 [Bulinus truncatus]
MNRNGALWDDEPVNWFMSAGWMWDYFEYDCVWGRGGITVMGHTGKSSQSVTGVLNLVRLYKYVSNILKTQTLLRVDMVPSVGAFGSRGEGDVPYSLLVELNLVTLDLWSYPNVTRRQPGDFGPGVVSKRNGKVSRVILKLVDRHTHRHTPYLFMYGYIVFFSCFSPAGCVLDVSICRLCPRCVVVQCYACMTVYNLIN